ncbi:unnamed protein product [Orchesella dallaii]|uniref:Fibroblast growth factor n=1 Tax=Orchesella dallaii TaxID=48710 RepID=A0ABP1S4G2_9HEXA
MTARKLYNLCSDGHVQCAPLSSNAPKDSPNGVLIFETMLKEEGLRTRIKFHHTNKYLCFSKNGTLVERPHVRDGRCEFIEKQVGNYFQYEYAVLDGWMLGFSRSGNPTNGLKYIHEKHLDGCTKFLKLDSNVSEETFQ